MPEAFPRCAKDPSTTLPVVQPDNGARIAICLNVGCARNVSPGQEIPWLARNTPFQATIAEVHVWKEERIMANSRRALLFLTARNGYASRQR